MSYPLQPLSSLGDIQTGSTPLTSKSDYWGGDIPFVTPGDLDQILPVSITPRTLSDEGAQQSRILQKDAVMVCCIGSLGKIGIAGRTVVTNQQINSIEFDPKKIWPKFGFYACQRLKPQLLTMAPATTIAIVSKSKFGQLEIPVPPLPEQRRIAAILDQADALRAKRREALAQLDSLTQSIFIEMFGDPVTNPMNWPVTSLTDMCHCYSGGTPSKAHPELWEGTLPWFSAKDLKADDLFDAQDHISETVPQTSNLKLLPANTVTFCVRGMILAHTFQVSVLRVPATINQDLKALLPKVPVETQYLAACLRAQSDFVLKQVSEAGHGTKRLDALGLREIRVLLPPEKLQKAFVSHVYAIELLRSQHRISLAELNTLFASLQPRAFRGEL